MEIRRTGNPYGLIFVGRAIQSTKKVQPVHKVQAVDHRFRYYFNQYIRKEDEIMERAQNTDFKALLEKAEQALQETFKDAGDLTKIQREIANIGNTIDFLRNDLPKVITDPRRKNLFAKTARDLEIIRTDMITALNKHEQKFENQQYKAIIEGRSLECPHCRKVAGFSIQEWWQHEKFCPYCKGKIVNI